MKKIGKIKTRFSIVEKSYEVVEIEGNLFAGKDAFLFPNNIEDLRAFECLSFPNEWEWTQRYIEKEGNYGQPKVESSKYNNIHGEEALIKIEEIISRHETGCISLFDGKYPYTIPINHAYKDGKLYMHCGKKGKKLNLIRQNSSASYTIYGNATDLPKNVRSCHLEYESIVLCGNIRICENPQEKEEAIFQITNQYGTPYQHGFADMIEILVFDIDYATARDGRFKPSYRRNIYYYKFS